MSDISQLDVLVRVLVAAGLGALIGLERERHAVAAGIRTHMLVAVGACLLTGTAQLVVQDLGVDSRADVLRIASGIATGVGFIGAGTIIMTGGRVKGLTTAATIWVTAAVGITAGYGYLFLALLVAGPITVSILMLGLVEKRLIAGGVVRAGRGEATREPGRRGADVTGGARLQDENEGAGGETDDSPSRATTGRGGWRPGGDG